MASFLEPFYGGRLYPDNLCDGRYRIRRCSQCEFIYQQVILDDNGMQLLYQDWVDHAFEHMPDPVQTLPELCCCLNAEGVLYLRVAAGGDVAERLQQRGWSAQRDAIHPLEHITALPAKH